MMLIFTLYFRILFVYSPALTTYILGNFYYRINAEEGKT